MGPATHRRFKKAMAHLIEIPSCFGGDRCCRRSRFGVQNGLTCDWNGSVFSVSGDQAGSCCSRCNLQKLPPTNSSPIGEDFNSFLIAIAHLTSSPFDNRPIELNPLEDFQAILPVRSALDTAAKCMTARS
jgi:hypothetical protein